MKRGTRRSDWGGRGFSRASFAEKDVKNWRRLSPCSSMSHKRLFLFSPRLQCCCASVQRSRLPLTGVGNGASGWLGPLLPLWLAACRSRLESSPMAVTNDGLLVSEVVWLMKGFCLSILFKKSIRSTLEIRRRQLTACSCDATHPLSFRTMNRDSLNGPITISHLRSDAM